MVESKALDWIAQKAAELLEDKVKDAPLTSRDIDMAFDAFARPRLEHLTKAADSEAERRQAYDFIIVKLQERTKQLNAEHWPGRST